jgi:ATP-binding cassette subfamily B protein
MGLFGGLAAEAYDRQYDDSYLIRRVLTYFAPHRQRVLILVVMVIIFALVGAFIPVLISAGVQALQDQSGGNMLPLIVAGLLAIGFFDYGIYHVRRRLTARLVADVISELRKDAFNAAIERDLAFYDESAVSPTTPRN